MACDLCNAKKSLNSVMFVGPNIFVIECRTCKVPMAVSKEHKKEFTLAEKSYIPVIFYKHLKLQGKIDWNMRAIKDHAHCHLR